MHHHLLQGGCHLFQGTERAQAPIQGAQHAAPPAAGEVRVQRHQQHHLPHGGTDCSMLYTLTCCVGPSTLAAAREVCRTQEEMTTCLAAWGVDCPHLLQGSPRAHFLQASLVASTSLLPPAPVAVLPNSSWTAPRKEGVDDCKSAARWFADPDDLPLARQQLKRTHRDGMLAGALLQMLTGHAQQQSRWCQ